MLDWLTNTPAAGEELRLPLLDLGMRITAAMVAGFTVAGVFRATIVSKDRSPSLPTTLVLLTVLTAIVTLVIGSNVARAFGLVGALSIVRFRTVVEDTRDTSFVIFAVVVGMAVGANFLMLALLAIIAVALVSAIMRWAVPSGRMQKSLRVQAMIRIAQGVDLKVLRAAFDRHSYRSKTISISTAKQGTALDIGYILLIPGHPEGLMQLIAELQKIEGVQSIEINENVKS
jgi:hypothetical protein